MAMIYNDVLTKNPGQTQLLSFNAKVKLCATLNFFLANNLNALVSLFDRLERLILNLIAIQEFDVYSECTVP